MSVVLFAGQSNGLGYLNEGPADYAPTWRVRIWTDLDGDGRGDAFVVMVPGWNTGTAANPRAWGPEVGFARDWLAAHADGSEVLYIGKVTRGETPLAEAPGLDWSPASSGELFDRAAATASAMRAALGVERLDAVFWMQGETDATDAAWAAAYADNLRTLLAAVRAEWMHDPHGYVGLGRLTDSPALAYNFEVRVAQWLVDQEDPDTESFRTIGFATEPDGVHYAPAGQLALGAAFFDNWIA